MRFNPLPTSNKKNLLQASDSILYGKFNWFEYLPIDKRENVDALVEVDF